MTNGRTTEFTVHDRDRELTFTGVLLGRSSSQAPGKRRWSEVTIYRTEAGKYVVEGVGRTNVRTGDLVDGIVAEADEEPFFWAHVCDEADGVVQSLYLYDDTSTRYMTKVARRALRAASKLDPDLRSAFAVERIA